MQPLGGGGQAGSGRAYGSGIFIQGNQTLTLGPTAGQTLTIADVIADMTGSHDASGLTGSGTLAIDGGGELVLSAANTYTGNTTVTGSGTMLSISADNNLGADSASLNLGTGTTLIATATMSFAHAITIAGNATFDVTPGNTLTINSVIANGASAGTLDLTGGGTLVLNTANSYSGGTEVVGGSTLELGAAGAAGSGAITLVAGTLDVLSGVTVSGITVSSGNTLIVSSGATASAVVLDGGTLELIGTASDPGLNWSSGTLKLAAGASSNNLVVKAGQTLAVLSEGIATGTTISSGGSEIVSSGGTASATTLQAGGTLELLGGAVDTALNWLGGTLELGSGYSASGLAVRAGDTLAVLSSGHATGTTVSNGGLVSVSAGATSGTTISSGGTEIVASGGSASATTLLAGGTLELLGSAVDTGLAWSGGTLELGAGDSASGTTVGAGETLIVASGGTATSATISNGGVAIVASGGIATAPSLLAGGTLELLSGATDTGLNWHGGTEEFASGFSASGVVVGAGETLALAAGGTATGATVSNGATLTVSAGGVATGTPTRATTVQAGGTLDLLNGATCSGPLAVSGGTLDLGGNAQSVGPLTLTSGTIQDGTLTASSLNVQAGTISAEIAGAEALIETGGGTLVLDPTGGSNTYSGGTVVQGGTLVVSSNNALGTGGLTLDAGSTINVTGIATLTPAITLSGDPTVEVDSGKTTETGVISGLGAELVKTGAGALVLDPAGGPSTYTSGTTIDGGTLELAAQGAAGTGAITFNGAETLQIDAAAQPASGGTFANAIADFGAGDTIDLRGFALATGAGQETLGFAGNSLTIGNGVASETLTLAGALPSAVLAEGDGNGGTDLVGFADMTGAVAAALAGRNVTLLSLSPVPSFNVASASDLINVLTAIDVGGLLSALNTNYVVNLSGNLTLPANLPAIDLAAGDTLTFSGNASLSGQGLTLDDATVVFAPPAGQTLTVNDAIAGSGLIDMAGDGNLTLAGPITGMTIEMSGTGNLSLPGNLTGDSFLADGSAHDFNLTSDFSGSGSITVGGFAVLIVSGDNTNPSGLTPEGSSLLFFNSSTEAGTEPITLATGSDAVLAFEPGDVPSNQIIDNFMPGETIRFLGFGPNTAATLGDGNVLTVTDGTNTAHLILDPGVDLSPYRFSVTPFSEGAELSEILPTFNAASASDIANVLNEINAGGVYSFVNTDYVINLTANVTQAADLPAINLAAGDILTFTGNATLSGSTLNLDDATVAFSPSDGQTLTVDDPIAGSGLIEMPVDGNLTLAGPITGMTIDMSGTGTEPAGGAHRRFVHCRRLGPRFQLEV